MTQSNRPTDPAEVWRRRAWKIGVPVAVGLALVVVLWKLFVHYVPPGYVLVVTSKTGSELEPGQLLANPGQKGVLAEVRGEGWHFIWPILYETELKKAVVIEAGKVGVVTARGGAAPAGGRELAGEGEKGIRRRVLTPGTYRLSPLGYEVEKVDAVVVHPGFVGVLRRKVGRDARHAAGDQLSFAEGPDDKGVLKEVLQPGLYYLNPYEYEVLEREVGIYQTTFHKGLAASREIKFRARDGYDISLDCTVEWEVLPGDAAALALRYTNFPKIEEAVIVQSAGQIGRALGTNYGAQELLDGATREQYQAAFRDSLRAECRKHGVQIHSAYIRDIEIPDKFLAEKCKRQLAIETARTNEIKQKTIASANEVAKERSLIAQEVAKVNAETQAQVAVIDQKVDNVKSANEEELKKLRAETNAVVAALEAERTRLLGEAEAGAKEARETATASLYKMKMDVFKGDTQAFQRYTLADQLNPKLSLRLFHAGPGTFWTNLGDKNMSLMLPAPQQQPARSAADK
jgi:hypothetical protein